MTRMSFIVGIILFIFLSVYGGSLLYALCEVNLTIENAIIIIINYVCG